MNETYPAEILETTIDSKRVFDGIILHIDHLTNRLSNGRTAPREVARHIGASAVLPLDDEGNAYLVRQFRAPINQVLLEIPAGKLDSPDEDRQKAAERELSEETGFTARSWTHLTDMVSSPGFTDERISLYLARDLESGESHPDEDEFLNLVRMPLKDVVDAILRGEITDAKTICAVMMASRLA